MVSEQSIRLRGSRALTLAPFVAALAMLLFALLFGANGSPGTTAPAPGTLQVFTRLLPGAAFTEGAVDYVVVEGEGGEVILDEAYVLQTLADPPLTRELPSGVYVLTHYQRPCAPGSCDVVGPKVGECRRLLALPPGAVVEATVSTLAGHPCSIQLLSGS
jgi:hypothetical protein